MARPTRVVQLGRRPTRTPTAAPRFRTIRRQLPRSKAARIGLDGTLAIASFEPAHDEVRTRHILEVADDGVVRAAPPRAPMIGTTCAASFYVTTTPKRDAACAMNRTRTGAPSARLAFGDGARASATDLASIRGQRNTRSPPHSPPHRAYPGRTPPAARALSGFARSSPSLHRHLRLSAA